MNDSKYHLAIDLFKSNKLVSFTLIIVIISIVASVSAIFIQRDPEDTLDVLDQSQPTEAIPSPTITQEVENSVTVDVSGAVLHPGTYMFKQGDRMHVAIEKAGGLTDLADHDFYFRNYNNARLLYDQEKIYIPRKDEVEQKVFVEGTYVINHSIDRIADTKSAEQQKNGTTSGTGSKVDVNTAGQEELETLTGIGPVTAKKIIDNRPYSSIDELLDKGVLGEATFLKVKDNVDI